MIEVTDRVPGERTRLVVWGRRTDDTTTCTLVVIHEDSGTWTIHGLGNPGVRVPTADMTAPGPNTTTRNTPQHPARRALSRDGARRGDD